MHSNYPVSHDQGVDNSSACTVPTAKYSDRYVFPTDYLFIYYTPNII
jgi:hypothetical protein